MKPLFILLTFLSSFFASSSYATDPISSQAVKSFQQTFINAQNAVWTASENFYKVEFSMNGQVMTAFYNMQGEFAGVTRNIISTQLPVMLQAEVKKEYSEYWISELFELSNNNGTEYYLTLENADSKIVLKSSGHTSWYTYQKSRK